MKTLRNFKRYKPDENSAVFKKFGPYTKLFLQDENGNDWYDAQKLFSSGTLKIAYIEENGLIKMAAMDADMLVPIGLSVTEVDASILQTVDKDTLIEGKWMHRDGKIQPRIYSAEEHRKAAAMLKEEKQRQAENKIAPLARAVRLGMATEEEKTTLTQWETYSVLLNRVDISTAPDRDIDWPQQPDKAA